MISAFFATLLGGIKTTITLGIIGAMVGVGALVIGRLISGLTGYVAAAALGAVILVGAYGSASFDSYKTRQKDAEIAQLKYDKAKLTQSLLVEAAAREKQEEIVAEAEAQHVADAQQMIRLEQLAAEHKAEVEEIEARAAEVAGDCPKCPTPKCIYPDELREIFRK